MIPNPQKTPHIYCRFIAKPFNFYIFKRALKSWITDFTFSSQSGSLRFLAENKFDFNKLVYHGIPCLSREEEREACAQQQAPVNYNNINTDTLPPLDQEFLKKIEADLDNLLLVPNSTHSIPPISPFKRRLVFQTITKKNNEIAASSSNPLFLKGETLPFERGKQTTIRGMKISTSSTPSEAVLEQQLRDKQSLTFVVGFRRVLEELVSKQCVMVGHNLMLDICHTVKMIKGSLSPNLNDMKKDVKELFGGVIDTKLIVSAPQFAHLVEGDTSLGTSYEKLVEKEEEGNHKKIKVQITEEEGFDRYNAIIDKIKEGGTYTKEIYKSQPRNKSSSSQLSSPEADREKGDSSKNGKEEQKTTEDKTEDKKEKGEEENTDKTKLEEVKRAHEAGYDAYMTGAVFIKALYEIGRTSKVKGCKGGKMMRNFVRDKGTNIPVEGNVNNYFNKMFLMRSDIGVIDLDTITITNQADKTETEENKRGTKRRRESEEEAKETDKNPEGEKITHLDDEVQIIENKSGEDIEQKEQRHKKKRKLTDEEQTELDDARQTRDGDGEQRERKQRRRRLTKGDFPEPKICICM